jgi:ribose transport system substrate-binding protein
MEKDPVNLDRRRFLILSAGAAAVPSLYWTSALAQDATPAASPVADPATAYGPVQGTSAYRLAYMQVFPDNPFWNTMKEAVEARAAENGVTVDTFALPTASGVADQVSQMENAVTQQYDGIILGTVDAAGIVPGIEAANAAGIPVIAVDTAPAGGDFISLVQTDNIAASQLGGNFIAEQIGNQGKVLNLQGDLANQTGQARNDGLHLALDAFPDIQVIDQSAMWQQANGLAITENILTSDPDIVAIFAANDPAALGAVQALKAAGRDDVIVVGFDGTEGGLEAVKSGDLAADVLQFPDVMGIVGVDLLVRHLNGEEVPERVDSGSGLATAENVDQYLG